ncbi:MAG: 50S ribosomal protein L34e [Candidatus Woesearchaeota archaeon]
MTAPRHKSRTMRRVKRKTPGNRVVTHYKPRKPSRQRCAITGEKLHGVPQERPLGLRKLSKTQKRPERPYGGVLSSKGLREVMKQKARDIE